MQTNDTIGRRGFLSAVAGIGTTILVKGSGARPAASSWIPSSDFLDRLPTLMRVACVPGLSMAVVERGAVVWSRSFGVLNASTGELVRDDTPFEAGSMSKSVFAYAVLQLADAKRIDLDKPLVSYHRPPYLPEHPDIDRITARHVLTHSTGLPNWGDDNKPETLIPGFTPGTFFSYSGEGMFWLQLVAEHITESSLDALVRKQLFAPAGMKSSCFVGDAESLAHSAWGHQGGRVARDQGLRNVVNATSALATTWNKPMRDWTNDDWVKAASILDRNAPPPKRVRFSNSAASLVTTARDYATFLSLLVARPSRASWEITDATRRAMVAPQIAIQPSLPLWWGLGVSVEKPADGWRVGHEGNNDGRFTAYSGCNPAAGRGLVVLTNAGSGFGVYQRIVRAATGLDQLSFIAELHPLHSSSSS
jgi:CubicO group peptidase (beta-lactamase class C family)